jgi:hypothetical protein
VSRLKPRATRLANMSRLLFAGSGQEAAIHKADEGRGLGDSNVKRAGPSQRTQDESLWDSRDEPGLPAGRRYASATDSG